MGKIALAFFMMALPVFVIADEADLFIHPANGYDLTPAQSKVLEYLKSKEMNSKVTPVRVNRRAFASSQVKFNISSAVSMKVETTEYDTAGNTSTWMGDYADSPDAASMVIRGSNVTGTIQNKDSIYSIRPIGGGMHVIIEHDSQAFPEEHPPQFDNAEKSGENLKDIPGKEPVRGGGAGGALDVNGIHEIYTLVAYTPLSKEITVDPVGLIQLAIDTTNKSYARGNIPVKLVLTDTVMVDYAESGDYETDLDRLSGNSDGYMDGIHGLRRDTKSDIVILITNDGSYCGLANAILANDSTAFALVHHGCATANYSFAHEVGHLQGARHNPEADSTSTPFPYGHGIYFQDRKVRTIMSYDCPAGCMRIPYWSDPGQHAHGGPMGTPELHHDARVLKETAPILSGFY